MAQFLNFRGDYTGLSADKAADNLEMYGSNIFRETENKSFKVYHYLFDPTAVLLFAAGIIQIAALSQYATGIMCLAMSVAQIITLCVICRRSNDSIRNRTMSAKMKYRVIRDSSLELIPAAMLVPDDIIIVQGGEIVPADAHILECTGLTVDESRFTEDPTPVAKHDGSDPKANGLKKSCIYAETRILSGSAVARVVATGEDTYRARNGEKLGKSSDPNFSRYEKTCVKLRLPLAIAATVICVLGVLLQVLTGRSTDVMGVAVSACGWLICMFMPFVELFIRMYNINFVRRIERKGAIIKNLTVPEKLNGLTTLVIDKSAVVAPNMLEVAGIYSKNPDLMTTVTVLSCDRDEPTLAEQAFLLNAALGGADVSTLKRNEVAAQFPYNDTDRIGGNIYKMGDRHLVCVKGSVEKITGLCDMHTDMLFEITNRAASLAKRGLEVWASAYYIVPDGEELPKSLYSVCYNYMGLVSFMSATRDMIPLAMQGCRRAGVKLVLTSSDSPETASSMGKKIGLSDKGMISGDTIAESSLTGEKPNYTDAEIFCRVSAAQRITIIDELRAAGETVAVVGYSDNDYEMVTHADLGITSLENTTGCVYEASGLIVRDDNFASVVEMIKEARQLHRNIKRCIFALLSSLVMFSLTAIADMAAGSNAVTPMLAALLTAVVIPLCCTGFRNVTADIKSDMTASGFISRGKGDRMFFIRSLACGAICGVISAIFVIIMSGLLPTAQVSSALLTLLTVMTGTMAVESVDKRPGSFRNKTIPKYLLTAVISTSLAAILLPYIPFVNSLFGFAMPHPLASITAVIAGVAPAIAIEIKKHLN